MGLKSASESVGKLSIWGLLILSFQLFGILSFSAVAPLVLRNRVLPSLADYEHPLNFVFTTCLDQLSGVCSFPEARFVLEEAELSFAADTPYSLAIDVELSPLEQNRHLGVFLVTLHVHDENLKPLASYQRSTFFKDPTKPTTWSLYRLARNTFFFPLYAVGYFDPPETGHVRVELTKNFIDKANNAVQIVVQIQNRFIHVDSAKLLVTAHFGLLRYFLYQWPLISYCVVFAATFLCLLFSLLLVKAYGYVVGDAESEPSEGKSDKNEDNVDGESEVEKVVKRKPAPIRDECVFKPLSIEPPKMPPRPVQVVGLKQNGDSNALRQRKTKFTN